MTQTLDTFAKDWEEAWNSHNIDVILAHYREDIEFRSQKAQPILGTTEIKGKDELRRYWSQALIRQPNLRFRVQDVFLGADMMVITYLNHNDILAAETLYFDTDGLVFRASACHRP